MTTQQPSEHKARKGARRDHGRARIGDDDENAAALGRAMRHAGFRMPNEENTATPQAKEAQSEPTQKPPQDGDKNDEPRVRENSPANKEASVAETTTDKGKRQKKPSAKNNDKAKDGDFEVEGMETLGKDAKRTAIRTSIVAGGAIIVGGVLIYVNKRVNGQGAPDLPAMPSNASGAGEVLGEG